MRTTFRRVSLVFFALGPVFIAAPARAAEEGASSRTAFGGAGQLVLSGGTQLQAFHTSYSAVPGGQFQGTSTTVLFVEPSVDVFVVRGLSLGAAVAYTHQEIDGGAGSNGLTLSPRIGYNVALGEHLSFWPTAHVAWGEYWLQDSRSYGTSIGASAPILYHPASHVFLGIGPTVTTTISSSDRSPAGIVDSPHATTFGVAVTVGGWIGS